MSDFYYIGENEKVCFYGIRVFEMRSLRFCAPHWRWCLSVPDTCILLLS